MTAKDDRRYMTYEERAKDDPRYRGKINRDQPKSVFCYCGKTMYVDGFGAKTNQTCPRNCESYR